MIFMIFFWLTPTSRFDLSAHLLIRLLLQYQEEQLEKKIRDTLRSHLGQNTHVWTTAKPQLDRISGKKDNFLKALPWSIGRLRGKPYVREIDINSNELQIPVKFEHRANKL